VRHIIAVEFLTAAQAVDLRPDGPARLGRGTSAVYDKIRSRVRFLEHDRALTPDIETISDLIRSGAIIADVRKELDR
jgi:histidine ammonia-lyase